MSLAPQSVAEDQDDRATPLDLFGALAARFDFSIDVAATPANAKCERFYTKADDGLVQSWADEAVWCNPPYSDIPPWVRKAWEESHQARAIVLLVPAVRTEQPWWQAMVEPYRDRPGSPLGVEFIAGRTRFSRPGESTFYVSTPPFGCCLLIWQRLAFRPDEIRGGLFGSTA